MARSQSSPARPNDRCSSRHRSAIDHRRTRCRRRASSKPSVGARSRRSSKRRSSPQSCSTCSSRRSGPRPRCSPSWRGRTARCCAGCISGHRLPGILQLAVIGLTVRTIVGILSGTFMYFLQPVATTLALAFVFFGSLLFGRPMIARMASDFCPLSPEIASRPGVVRLFSGLTLLWAIVHLLSAATTFTMLVSLSTPTFVAVKSFVSLGHHDQRDRADGVVVDPNCTRRRSRVRACRALAVVAHAHGRQATTGVQRCRATVRNESEPTSERVEFDRSASGCHIGAHKCRGRGFEFRADRHGAPFLRRVSHR